jgi:hypothetical protein
MNGVSVFEIVNILMIVSSFIDLALKYYYDVKVWSDIQSATGIVTNISAINNQNGFVDFTSNYLFFEAITLLDAFTIFMMSLSIIKYTFFWIPSLGILTESFSTYFNSTIKRIVYFICLISLAFALYCYYFYSYICFGFYDLSYSMIRTNLLFIQGALFNNN